MSYFKQNQYKILYIFGDYTVSLTVTDIFGCTKTVSIWPEGTIAQIGLSNLSCIGTLLPFEDITANSSRRTMFIERQKIDDTSPIIYHSFQQPGIYEVTLIAIGSNGCSDTIAQSFEVYGLPQSAIQVIPFTNAEPVTNPEFQFKGLEENGTNYVWYFGYGNAIATGVH